MAFKIDLAVVPESLPEDLWREMVRLSGLPDEARPHVEEIIAIYKHNRELESNQIPGRDLRKALAEMEKCATKLLKEMRPITKGGPLARSWHRAHAMNSTVTASDVFIVDLERSAEEIVNASVGHSPTGPAQTVQRLDQFYDEVENFAALCAIGRMIAFPDKSGRRVEVLHTCINFLNIVLLSFTGRPLTRAKTNRLGYGPRDFALKVFARGDKTITKATITNAIKNHLTAQSIDNLARWRAHFQAQRLRLLAEFLLK